MQQARSASGGNGPKRTWWGGGTTTRPPGVLIEVRSSSATLVGAEANAGAAWTFGPYLPICFVLCCVAAFQVAADGPAVQKIFCRNGGDVGLSRRWLRWQPRPTSRRKMGWKNLGGYAGKAALHW